MSGKVIKGLLIGGALIGAAFIPGLGTVAGIGLKSVFLSAGVSIALNTVLGTPKIRQGAILQGVIDTQAPLPVVYGKTKLGIRYVERRSAGEDNKDFYIVGALCHGSEDGTGIQAIDEIFLDDRLAVTPDGTVQFPFKDKLTVTKYLGTDTQNTDPVLAATFQDGWTANSRGRGVAYLVLKLTYDAELWATGEPTVTAMVRGCKVKDPANLGAAAAYSTNPARCIYDYLVSTRYGLAATAAEVDATSFATMATYYDTSVTKDNTLGTTGALFTCNGVLDVGQSIKENLKQLTTCCRGIIVYEGGKYRLVTRRVTTPTSFTLSEANLVGDWQFSVPGMGSAPNIIHGAYIEPNRGVRIFTLTNAEPIAITTEEPHGYITGQRVYLWLDAASQGIATPVLGLFKITRTGASTFTLDETEAPGAGYIAYSTRVTAENFPHQPATRIWPRPGAANGYLTADNNYQSISEVALPFTNDPYTAEQILLVSLKEARSGLAVSVTALEAALQLQVGDVVPVTHPTPGWTAKDFWVMGVFLIPSTGLVRLALLEYDASAYTLDALATIPTTPATGLPNPFDVAPVPSLTLVASVAEAEADADGSHRVYIRATWEATTHPYLDYYEVEYRQSGTFAYQAVADRAREDLEALIGPVSEGANYDVRVRAVNTIGKTSPWLEESITPQLPTLQRSGSFWIDDFSSQTPGRRWIQFSGTGTILDTYDPDSLVGGKVGRVTGPAGFYLADAIPFDPGLFYTMRWRVRQLRDPAAGSKTFSIGVIGLAEVPGQTGVFTHVNTFGLDSLDNQHWVVTLNRTLNAGRAWTDLYGYIRGYAGGKVALTAAMISHSGLGNFSAANCCDGDTSPSQTAFDTDSAVAGAVLIFDLGVARTITEARMHMSAEGSVANWEFEFADDAGGPWTAVT